MTSTGQPSGTALTAAAARAAHLVVDRPPLIFVDPLAETLLGAQAEELIAYHRAHGGHLVLAGARAQVTCRSRYTEERLAHGAGQYVILGAGLDSFAYRSRLADRVRVFEVDHPASQKWKRQRLAAARIAVPETVAYVPTDLETDALADRLAAVGFDSARPALVSWLGVTMYLTRAAIAETLAAVGRFAAGTELVADYMVPEELRDSAGRTYVELVGPVTAGRGEPWLTFLTPDEFTDLLARHGFQLVEHAEQRTMVDAALWQRHDALAPSNLARIVRARIPSRRPQEDGP